MDGCWDVNSHLNRKHGGPCVCGVVLTGIQIGNLDLTRCKKGGQPRDDTLLIDSDDVNVIGCGRCLLGPCQLADTSTSIANSCPSVVMRLCRMLPPAALTAWLRSRTRPVLSAPMAVIARSFSMFQMLSQKLSQGGAESVP